MDQFKRRKIPALTSKDSSLCLNAVLWSSQVIYATEKIHTLQRQTFIVMEFSIQGTQNNACAGR